MKVALVAHAVRPTGGQDRYLLELARRLPFLGADLDVHLVAARIEGALPLEVEVHRVPLAPGPMFPFARRFATRAAAMLSGRGFDLVHAIGASVPGAHVITAQFCHAAWRLARRRYRVWDGGALRSAYRRVVNVVEERAERAAYHSPSLRCVLPVSTATASDLERLYGPLRAPVRVVPNGVDLGEFHPTRRDRARPALMAELGLPADTDVALFVGAFERKGLDTAIAAVAASRHRPFLAVVGEGDRSRALRLAARAGVADRLRLLGSRADMADLFSAADVQVFPTRYDPFGMVVTEGMACGLPPVVSAVAGAAEYVVSHQNGVRVGDPTDWSAFAAGVDWVLDRRAAGEPLVDAARQAVAALDWANIARQVADAYLSCAPCAAS